MGVSKVPTHSVDVLRLGNTQVLDENGEKIVLRDRWVQDRPNVIVFIRHFACIACRAHVAQILKIKDKFEQMGCHLMFIGHGDAQALHDFKENMSLQDVEIYTDPTRETFLACSFKKGFRNLINLKSVTNMVSLAIGGHRQTSHDPSQGIHRQMGGIVVVAEKEKVKYHYISEAVGDFPPEEKTLEEIAATRVEAAKEQNLDKDSEKAS